MDFKLPEDPRWIILITGIFFSTIGFTIYHFLNRSTIKKRLVNRDSGNNVKSVLFQRLSGVFIYGIIPVILLLIIQDDFDLTSLTGNPGINTVYWFLPLSAVIILMNYLNAGSNSNLEMYPEIKNKKWSPALVFLSGLSWVVYLFAYELIFRAFLFIPAYELTGFWPAVILNIGIYSLVHVPKGKKEGIGAIFLGFILCFLVVKTGSFWIAFFLHIVLALSNEWFSIIKNPQIKIERG